MENKQPAEKVQAEQMEERKTKLSEIAKILREYQGKISITQYETTLQFLFTLVPELESIQKTARLRVPALASSRVGLQPALHQATAARRQARTRGRRPEGLLRRSGGNVTARRRGREREHQR